jgi:tetratricopeptide (TPR) repeat protein
MREKYIDMKRLGAVLVATIAMAAIVLGIGPGFERNEPAPELATELPSMPTAQAISLFQDRVSANEDDAVSATILGELFSRQARETGDVSKLQLAETSLDRALGSLPDYPRAQTALAAVYIAQHRFDEALALARIANEADPEGGAIITIGDAQLALGEYEAARQTFLGALERFSVPVVSARLAHIDEIFGDLEGARRTVDKAAAAFIASGGGGEAAAWFEMRRGDLAFASGDYEAAASAYRDSLVILPEYPASLAGLGRSLAALGDTSAAIASYERAATAQPLPQVLLALGELYELDGREEEASEAFATINVVSELTDGLFDLSLVFYEANHGDPEVAVRTAEQLVGDRPDLFSFDALAWAHFRAGNLDEARAASDIATSTNPAIASIWYHAGAISAALGQAARASTELERAMSLSPRFDPVASLDARQLLEDLQS